MDPILITSAIIGAIILTVFLTITLIVVIGGKGFNE